MGGDSKEMSEDQGNKSQQVMQLISQLEQKVRDKNQIIKGFETRERVRAWVYVGMGMVFGIGLCIIIAALGGKV